MQAMHEEQTIQASCEHNSTELYQKMLNEQGFILIEFAYESPVSKPAKPGYTIDGLIDIAKFPRLDHKLTIIGRASLDEVVAQMRRFWPGTAEEAEKIVNNLISSQKPRRYYKAVAE